LGVNVGACGCHHHPPRRRPPDSRAVLLGAGVNGNGKTIGILCSGPSVRGFLEQPVAYASLIGVNRMAAVYPCNWWACRDRGTFIGYVPVGMPKIFTSDDTWQWLGEELTDRVLLKRAECYAWTTWAMVKTPCPALPQWKQGGFMNALILADWLGARDIKIHGADWAGSDDFDGSPPIGGTRPHYRWPGERDKFAAVASWLTQERGITIERVGFERYGVEVAA